MSISIKRTNFSFKKSKPIAYYYIENFSEISEKFCKQCDKENHEIYEKNLILYTRTKKLLEKNDALFKIGMAPVKPHNPSNYELYLIHKNRISETNNKIQTCAVLYLIQLGYKLVIDPPIEYISNIESSDTNLFEPYMAIRIELSIDKNFVNEIVNMYQLNYVDLNSSPDYNSIKDQPLLYPPITHLNESLYISSFQQSSAPPSAPPPAPPPSTPPPSAPQNNSTA